MATRIRLQRHGKKNQPFYHIVIADGRAPRDGRFIERIGSYNPLTHPATITIDFDRALYWVETGASPSDTARALLKREGVYLMKHLRGGIAKGALTEIAAQHKFESWQKEKELQMNAVKREKIEKERSALKKKIEVESKIKEAISAKVAAKYSQQAVAEAAKAKEEVPVDENAKTVEDSDENTNQTEEQSEIAAE